MANDLNQCQFIGRLGRDPEVRYTAAGEAACNFSLAVGWKGKDKEGTEWVNCSAFGKLAEIAGEYLKKGKQCYVQGRMSTREYTDKDGVKKYSTSINVDRLQLLGSRDGAEGAEEASKQKPAPKTHGQMLQEARGQKSGTGFDDMDDDIPFASECMSFDMASPMQKRFKRYRGV